MAKRRGGVGVATWHGFLYAIGGHDAPASSLASRLSDCVERLVYRLLFPPVVFQEEEEEIT